MEYVRAATALDGLPRLRALFGQGELSWYQVRAITRVATTQTECAWIELAFEVPVRELHSEVREAQRTGRDAPREKRLGLPNLLVKMTFEMTLEEKERVRAALARVSDGLGDDAGNGLVEDSSDKPRISNARPVLVRWADGILSGAIPAARPAPEQPADSGAESGRPGGAKGARRVRSAADRPTPAQTILYRVCPQCRDATVDTEDGKVSVSSERVDELAPAANRIEIAPDEELVAGPMKVGELDDPNTVRLARQVLHRDGLRCTNPACSNRNKLNAHHIMFRASGGRTVLANEAAVCDVCHSLLHVGRLDVSGTPDLDLKWTPRPVDSAAKMRDVAALRAKVRALPAPPAGTRSAPIGLLPRPAEARPQMSTAVDMPTTVVQFGRMPYGGIPSQVMELADGLVGLGWSREESTRRIREAYLGLVEENYGLSDGPAEAPTEEAILIRAIKMK